tara:strand:+ start:458 stop:577 length:120 start_codon:yes stop_codon:yes gene_type:complete
MVGGLIIGAAVSSVYDNSIELYKANYAPRVLVIEKIRGL